MAFVLVELVPDPSPEWRSTLNLSSGPHAELQNPLELFWRIVPPVVIAVPMRRKVVFERMPTTTAVGQNMISLPLRPDASAADMTFPTGAFENSCPLALRELPSSNAPVLTMALLPRLMEPPETAS